MEHQQDLKVRFYLDLCDMFSGFVSKWLRVL